MSKIIAGQNFAERIEEIRSALYEIGKGPLGSEETGNHLTAIVRHLRFQIRIATTESQFVQARALLNVALHTQVRHTNAVMAIREEA